MMEMNRHPVTDGLRFGRKDTQTRVDARRGCVQSFVEHDIGRLAPDPGVYGRTALGSCLAIGYQFWAAKLGVVFSRLEVDVQADYDSGGYHGVTDVPPGYSQVRYIVSVDSDAPEADVLNVLDQADAHSPYRDVFTRALDVRREVRVAQHKG